MLASYNLEEMCAFVYNFGDGYSELRYTLQGDVVGPQTPVFGAMSPRA